jgi:DNA recombination protein RmuC
VAAAAAERNAAQSERDRERAEHGATADELRAAEARATDAAARLKSQEEAETALKASFAQMSVDALRRNTSEFLELADDRFKRAGMPLNESLTKVEAQLGKIEKDRASANAALAQQIKAVGETGEQLRLETASLVNALRKPQARGQWGELQLRRCVEFAGMVERCDFVEQQSVTTADGTIRPDLVVRLVGGKQIVVDAKVTLSAFLEAHDATDDIVREERLDAHARHLRQHVDQLATKAYWSQLAPTPEFVILFVPGEAFLPPALERDPALLEDAVKKRVHIVTPMSLIATLRTVAYAWQQQALAENARDVFDLGRELYKRLGTMGDHMDKLGRSLTGAVKAYNGTVGSMEKNVLVTARKLNALEVTDATLDDPNPVEEPVRPLGAPELVTSAEDARTVVVLPAVDDELDGRSEDYGIDAAGAPVSDRWTGS